MINKKLQVFFRHIRSLTYGAAREGLRPSNPVTLRGVAGPYPFFWQKLMLLKKATKVGYFFKIPFTSSSLWSEKNYKIFFRHLRGVAGPHPFFASTMTVKKLGEAVKQAKEKEERSKNIVVFGVAEEENQQLESPVEQMLQHIGQKPGIVQ